MYYSYVSLNMLLNFRAHLEKLKYFSDFRRELDHVWRRFEGSLQAFDSAVTSTVSTLYLQGVSGVS